MQHMFIKNQDDVPQDEDYEDWHRSKDSAKL
jgi:hypothetical protein